MSKTYVVAVCDDRRLPKGTENDIKETGWSEGTGDEEAGYDAFCLLAFLRWWFEVR